MFDLKRLKEIAQKLGGVLVMNGNEPEVVIMSYERFNAFETNNNQSGISDKDEEVIDALNKEILALKEEIRLKEMSEAQII